MKPVVVSLDHNALSDLAVCGDICPEWRRLRDVLASGLQAGQLVCPVSHENLLEMAACPSRKHSQVAEVQRKLSLGIAFKKYRQLLKEETLALVRPDVDTCPYEIMAEGWTEAATRRSRDAIAALKAEMQGRLDSFEGHDGREALRVDKIMEGISLDRCGDLYRNLENMLPERRPDVRDYMTIDICRYLAENGVTPDEIRDLMTAIRYHKWETIPIVYYDCLLSACMEHDWIRGRRATANDELDRSRTAMALWAADYHMTDAAVSELCRKAKTHDVSGTFVCGVRDRARLADLLTEELGRRMNS